VVSVTDPYSRILGFLDRSRYFSIKQLLSCTHEAEWTPFQIHYFFSGSAENRTRASGSVAKNSDHQGGLIKGLKLKKLISFKATNKEHSLGLKK
jgi:hypothetical protein